MEFSGPPLPSRDTTSTLVNLSERLETADLDSLPALADEVAQGQKHQLAELEGRKQYLMQLKNEFEKVNKQVNSLANEIKNVQRKIFFTEDQIEANEKSVKDMLETIENHFDEMESLRIKLVSLESKLKIDRERYEAARAKMFNFDEKVKQPQENSKKFKEIKVLEDEKARLNGKLNEFGSFEERQGIVSGEKAQKIESNIKLLKQQENELKMEIQSIEKQSRDEEDRQKKITIDTRMLHKRNNAQMIRMKRQLQDGNRRAKNLTDDVAHLENRIHKMNYALCTDK
eukprot:gene9674-10660_t